MLSITRVGRATVSFACIGAILLSGCATSSKDVSTTYVSPITYRGYDCEQVAAETQRIQTRVQQLGARLDEAASNDKKLAGVGIVLFWPALFALGGTKEQEAEYGRLKGEYEALQQAYNEKKCSSAEKKPIASPSPAAAPATAASSIN